MRQTISKALQRAKPIIGDGAFGTQLQARGLPAGMMPEVWNEKRPAAVQEVHRAYVEAGADLITANTFGSNRVRLGEVGLAECSAELTRRGARLAREVAGDDVWVAGSVGPTGQLMDPYGPLSVPQAEELFAEQALALAEGGADFILIETHHDIEEACCALRAARQHTGLPVFCTFAFDARGRTMMGLRAGEAARRIEEAGGDAVGANCGQGPAAILAALEGMAGATNLPLIAQANAGIPQVGEGSQTVWDVTPAQMVEHARAFVSLGARIVGGCCGTGPEHIAAIAAALGH